MKERSVSGRIYAIGDVHGCCQELTALLSYLEDEERLTKEDQVVFVGDYIDRGPNSVGVLNRLIKFKEDYPSTIFLRGNHEDMCLGFLGLGGNYGNMWCYNGGSDVLKEYDLWHHIHTSTNGSSCIGSGLTKEEFRKLIPAAHRSFITSTERLAIVNDIIFVHAGLHPKRKFEDQTDEEFFWTREGFLMMPHPFGKTIIHGHTISPNPYFNMPYEISIDTGCFNSKSEGWRENGALTCLKITDSKNLLTSTFLQVLCRTDKVIDSVNGINIHSPEHSKEWFVK